jgi:hypothetical protein
LSAPEARVEDWRVRLPAGRKIAIAWRGGDQLHFFGQNRSAPLSEIERLLAVPDITSMGIERQIDDATALRLASKFNFVDVGQEAAHDLADLAAVLALCDMVVTVDCTSAHLAGAMGKPSFVLLNDVAMWCWHQADRSPWYPTLNLVRQQEPANWRDVVDRIIAALGRAEKLAA